jgi:hypothetical protein
MSLFVISKRDEGHFDIFYVELLIFYSKKLMARAHYTLASE